MDDPAVSRFVLHAAEPGARFTLTTNRADGVSEGAPVNYLGVNVGHVIKVEKLADNSGVSIVAVLNLKESVPSNVEGTIRASALSSTAQIDLDPIGDPSTQPIVNNARIKAHFGGSGLIPPEVTHIATEIRQQQLIAHLTAAIDTLRAKLESAGKLIDSTDQVMADPTSQADLRSTLASLHKTSDNFEKFSERLNSIGDETTNTLRQARTTIADSGSKVDTMSGQVTERMQQLAVVLDHVQSITDKVDRGDGTAGKLINDPRLYESLVDSSRDLDVTFKDMQRLVEQWEQDGFTLKLK